MSKRQSHRHTKRLETTFTAGGVTNSGITSDISEGGLFIRTRYGLVPETIVNIEIHLPDGKLSRLKGRVRRSIRTPISTLKNGMGVELIEKDSNYINFVKTMGINGDRDSTSSAQKSPEHDFSIVACPSCGIKNKVRAGPASLAPKCGKCGNPLTRQETTSQPPEYLIIACSNCKTKNKVSKEKISFGPRCGKCGIVLSPGNIV